jgi:flagellar hook-associated protein 1 FlgK
MATINSAFNLISSALEADQAALNVVANNVANANTPATQGKFPVGGKAGRCRSMASPTEPA